MTRGDRRASARRPLIAGVVLLVVGVLAYAGAWGLVARERAAAAAVLDRVAHIEFHFAIEQRRLRPIYVSVLGRATFGGNADVKYTAGIVPQPVTSESPVGFGWYWGNIQTEIQCVVVQRLTRYEGAEPLPEDLGAQLRREVPLMIDGFVPERVGRRSPVPHAAWRELWMEASLPVLADAVTPNVRIASPELGHRTAPWVLVAISGLSMLCVAMWVAGVASVGWWSRIAWKRRAWYRQPGVCDACGYRRGRLAVCPECGVSTTRF